MKIGVFDSGLGGLLILKAIRRKLPKYDYVYFGDTKRVPYGGRSQDVIYEFTKEGVEFLFSQGCSLVIIACNTASAEALRKIQQDFLPRYYPERRVLGVIVPTIEELQQRPHAKRIGLIATQGTVASRVYATELSKALPRSKLRAVATPLLVPLLENDGGTWIESVLLSYLRGFQTKPVDVLVLGCTHYCLLKHIARRVLEKSGTVVISQDEIIPKKLQAYLHKHPALEQSLGKHGRVSIFLSDMTPEYERRAKRWFKSIKTIQLVDPSI